MNVFPHMNLTLAKLASETLEPLKHLLSLKFYLLFFKVVYTSMTFSPRDFLIIPFPSYNLWGTGFKKQRIIICALVYSLIPEQTLYLVASRSLPDIQVRLLLALIVQHHCKTSKICG